MGTLELPGTATRTSDYGAQLRVPVETKDVLGKCVEYVYLVRPGGPDGHIRRQLDQELRPHFEGLSWEPPDELTRLEDPIAGNRHRGSRDRPGALFLGRRVARPAAPGGDGRGHRRHTATDNA